MRGLVAKDLLIIPKTNGKLNIMIVLIVFLYASFLFLSLFDLILFIPFIFFSLSLSSFNNDRLSNWNLYASAFPTSKKGIVQGKYFLIAINQIICFVVGGIFAILLYLAKGNIDSGLLANILLPPMFFLGVTTLGFPFIFKIENLALACLIAIYGGMFAIFIIGILIIQLIAFLELPFFIVYFVFFFLILVFFPISYKLSVKYFNRRDF